VVTVAVVSPRHRAFPALTNRLLSMRAVHACGSNGPEPEGNKGCDRRARLERAPGVRHSAANGYGRSYVAQPWAHRGAAGRRYDGGGQGSLRLNATAVL
jgi:hypothetical protein